MMPRLSLRLHFTAATSLLLTACSPDPRIRPPQNFPSTVVLEARTTDQFIIPTIDDVVVLDSNTVLVAADGGRMLATFDAATAQWQQLAGMGAGPGEVRGALWALRGSAGEIIGIDVMAHRTAVWSPARTWSAARPLGGQTITGAWVREQQLVVRYYTDPRVTRFVTYDQRGDSVAGMSIPADLPSSELGCGYCPAAVSPTGRVAAAVSDTNYRIIEYDASGNRLGTWEREGVPIARRTDAERDSIEGVWNMARARITRDDGTTSPASLARINQLAKTSGFHKRFLPNGLQFDNDCLLAQRSTVATDSAAIDVFDAERVFIGTLQLPPGTVMHAAGGAQLVTSRQLDDGNFLIEVRAHSACAGAGK